MSNPKFQTLQFDFLSWCSSLEPISAGVVSVKLGCLDGLCAGIRVASSHCCAVLIL